MKKSIFRASFGSSLLVAASSFVLVIACDNDSSDDPSNDDAGAGEAASGGTAAGGNSTLGGTKAQAGTGANGGSPSPADNEAGAPANDGNGGSSTQGGASSENGGAVADAGAGGVPACVPAAALPTDVPAGIVVAETATLLRSLHAVGTQNYRCTQTAGPADADPTFTWVFIAPVADLLNSCGAKVGSHFAVPGSLPPAPEWKYDADGSSVTGVKINSAPVVGSIPELLLTATDHGGDGVFAGVTLIQRLHTVGGAAPALADCTTEHVNEVAEVEYSAQYYFYSGGT
jgi:hypothetical protein